jgi:hypothetical protein
MFVTHLRKPHIQDVRAAKSHGLPVSLQVFALTSRSGWVSRWVSRWVLTVGLENLTDSIKMVLYAWFLHLCSEKIQFAKILSVLSKENPYVFVK